VTPPKCLSGSCSEGHAGQNCSSPALHAGHVPSSLPDSQRARSPGLNLETAEPTFVTRPTISWRGRRIYGGHDAAPLVANLVKIGVADAAEEDSICTSFLLVRAA